MIQILGIRDGKGCTFFDKNWRAKDIPTLFRDLDGIMSVIPEEERYNLYYTASHCLEEEGRKFLKQNIIPIDIDDIEPGTEEKVATIAINAIGLGADYKKIGVIASGNGVQLIILLENHFDDINFFKVYKQHYKKMCGEIDNALYDHGVQGKADSVVFSSARLLRLPNTKNIKKSKGEKFARFINSQIEPVNVDLVSLASLPELKEGDFIPESRTRAFPPPDEHAVCTGCPFIVHCKTNAATLSEPEWYAMLSIFGKFKDGSKYAHEYSKEHPGYSPDETDFKFEYAKSVGPRTCTNVATLWDGCKSCEHYGDISSPIQIVGADYIRTKETGFWDVVVNKGVARRTQPNYDDLVKYFEQSTIYRTDAAMMEVYKYVDNHWKMMETSEIHNFVLRNLKPSPNKKHCQEFQHRLEISNLNFNGWNNEEGRVNFKNCVYDVTNDKILDHDIKHTFTYRLDFDFDRNLTCPTWDKFVLEVANGSKELAILIEEFIGYCFSGTPPELVQKAAILYGTGANGKSTIFKIMQAIAGKDNCSSVPIKKIHEPTGRYRMVGKLFNVSDEMPTTGFLESDDFKSMVSGDTLEVKKLYKNPSDWKCNTKMMFACNELPITKDHSYGLNRRLLIIPFKARFSDELGNKDPFILDKLMKERGGILNKCLKRFKEVRDRSYTFTDHTWTKEAMDEFKEQGDVIHNFCQEGIEEGEGKDQLTVQQLFSAYSYWCDRANEYKYTFGAFRKRFYQTAKEMYPQINQTRKMVNGKRATYYSHLRIVDNNQGF